ncbi:unnamed protein product [Ascophyllum nodosum]
MSTLETAERILGIADSAATAEQSLEDDMDAAGVLGGELIIGGSSQTDGGRLGLGGSGGNGPPAWDVDEEDEAYEDPDLLAALPGLSIVGEGGVTTGDGSNVSPGFGKDDSESKAESRSAEECALLERAAHYALMMNADLQAAAEDESHTGAGDGDADAASLLRGMAPRASRVEAEITRRLRSEFASLVKPPQTIAAALADARRAEESRGEGWWQQQQQQQQRREKKRQALLSCLRPFSALGSGIEAEKQFARAVMQPFLDAKFTQGIVDGGDRGSSKALGPLLKDLLVYVKEVAGEAIEAAEDMFTAEGMATTARGEKDVGDAMAGNKANGVTIAPLPVDLVCSGVWRPLQQVFMTRLSGVFATGMVSAQHTNYLLCMEFLEGLAGVGGEEKRPRIRARLLAHASVQEFKARWNLPIYFQLRSREISTRLEAALTDAKRAWRSGLGGVEGGNEAYRDGEVVGEGDERPRRDGPAFELPVFREIWRCLVLCWDPEIFLPCLAHRFLRLSLQGIGRTGAWAGSPEVLGLSPDDIVPVASDLNKLLVALKTDLVSLAASRISAPAAGERNREGQGALPEEEAKELVGEAVAEAAGAWGTLVQDLWAKATSQVAEQCMAMLQAVKGITATYRMTNKPAPQRASPFVPNVLRALREFDARWGASASGQGQGGGDSWKDGVVLTVCTRYLEMVSELLQTVRQMENTLNKRRVTGRSRSSRAGAVDQGPSDKDKIMMQLRLDVSEFSREASRLGVDVSAFPPYERLLEVIEARGDARTSKQSTYN